MTELLELEHSTVDTKNVSRPSSLGSLLDETRRAHFTPGLFQAGEEFVITDRFLDLYMRMRDQKQRDEIAEYSYGSSADLSSAMDEGYPVVFRNMLVQPDQEDVDGVLAERFGGMKVITRLNRLTSIDRYLFDRGESEVSLGELVSNVGNGSSSSYMANQVVNNEVLGEVGIALPEFDTSDQASSPRMWLGPAGTQSPLHKDSSGNVIAQVYGKKRWVILPVADVPKLSMLGLDGNTDHAVSSIDITQNNVLERLRALGCNPLEVEVGQGDVLFVPEGSPHAVTAETRSLMMNRW